jgi:HTH-type transcriptional regulator/antitoxin HigA
MDVKPIKSEKDYEATLERIDALMDATIGTEEGDELDVLATLVEAYERDKYEIPEADPIEAIKFVMEQRGLKAKDLVSVFGSSGRVSEVLNYQRALSIGMIRNLHSNFSIPATVLIKSYDLSLSQDSSKKNLKRELSKQQKFRERDNS